MKHFLRLMTLGFGLFTLLCGPLALRPAAAASPNAASPQAEEPGNPNYYYLFNDILIPNVMDHAPDDDYSFETAQFKAGIQNFKGRVVFDDLVNFFVNNMARDGWHRVTAVRSQKTLLVFEKPSKAAIIELTDGFWARATVFAIQYKNGVVDAPPPGGGAGGVERYPGPAPQQQPAGGYSEKDVK